MTGPIGALPAGADSDATIGWRGRRAGDIRRAALLSEAAIAPLFAYRFFNGMRIPDDG